MVPVRSVRGEPDDETPKTRSYVDALLGGNLSHDQVEALRAEIGPEALRPPRSPRQSHVPASTMPPLSQQVWGTPSQESDDQPTVMRSYVPPADDDQPTVLRSYVPPAGDDDQPTMLRSYAPPVDDDDDDDRARVYVYSAEEIAGLGDLGDLDVPFAGERSVAPPPGGGDADVYLAALGGLGVVPRPVLPHGRVTDLPLGVEAAFVLSRIDGESSVEDILDISGLSRLTTLRILHELMQKGLLHVGAARG